MKALLRRPCLLALVLLLPVWLAGCGGGGSVSTPTGGTPAISQPRPVVDPANSGTLRVVVKWPTAGVSTKEIPPATQVIKVWFEQSGWVASSATITKPETQATLRQVPLGPGTVHGVAYDGTGASANQLAAGQVDVVVEKGENAPVNLVLIAVTAVPASVAITPTMTPDAGGTALPAGLPAGAFQVLLSGTAAPVTSVDYGVASGVSVGLVIDTTSSMLGTIDGVRSSIQAFADSLATSNITWGGIEFGDSTPSVGQNTWDFDGVLDQRTQFPASTDVAGLKTWLGTLTARGGGDAPENPLDALMEAKAFSWPAGVARHFIVFTDVGAHEPGDGTDFAHYTGAQVLAAFRGWGTVHTVSPDFSSYWSSTSGTMRAARATNKNRMSTRTVADDAGWDIRELADGGPPDVRTHDGTGGKWIAMPSDGVVDLTTLGLDVVMKGTYNITYTRPAAVTSATLVILVTVPGEASPRQYTIGTVEY